MKLLITGGFGYLGGRLATFLAPQDGYEVVLGSRRYAEPPSWLRQARVVQTRWDSSTDLEHACAGIDAVVHLAGANAQDCAVDPVGALEINGVATARLLQSAIRQGVRRFIYLSTAHVYGSPLTGTITEETCPVSLHPYSSSHRAGEDVVRAAHRRGEIEGIVIRLSNACGAPVHKDANCWTLLVNDLCRQAVLKRKLTLRSSGLQQRDFIAMSDVIRAIRHLLVLQPELCGDSLFNLGAGASLTVLEIAQRIAQRSLAILGFEPAIAKPDPDGPADSVLLRYDVGKLVQTGFQLRGGLEAEIDGTLSLCDAVWRAEGV